MDFQSYFLCSVDIIMSYNNITMVCFFQSSMKFGVIVPLIKKSLIQSSLLISLNLINLRNILEVRMILSEDAQKMFSIAFTFTIQNIFSILQWLYLIEEEINVHLKNLHFSWATAVTIFMLG